MYRTKTQRRHFAYNIFHAALRTHRTRRVRTTTDTATEERIYTYESSNRIGKSYYVRMFTPAGAFIDGCVVDNAISIKYNFYAISHFVINACTRALALSRALFAMKRIAIDLVRRTNRD